MSWRDGCDVLYHRDDDVVGSVLCYGDYDMVGMYCVVGTRYMRQWLAG